MVGTKIKAALRESKVLICLLTSDSIRRPWVPFEAGAFWLLDKPVIPVCFGDMHKGAMPQPFASLQALELPGDLFTLLSTVHDYTKPSLLMPPPVFQFALFPASWRMVSRDRSGGRPGSAVPAMGIPPGSRGTGQDGTVISPWGVGQRPSMRSHTLAKSQRGDGTARKVPRRAPAANPWPRSRFPTILLKPRNGNGNAEPGPMAAGNRERG